PRRPALLRPTPPPTPPPTPFPYTTLFRSVVGLHVGYVDTDMAAAVSAPKMPAPEVVHRALDGVEAGVLEILADETSRQVKAGLSADVAALYPSLGAAAR